MIEMKNRNESTWHPRPSDFSAVFREQNPWHKSGKVPDALARRNERTIAACLAERLRRDRPRRFQLVLGPRRVGKTTSMYQAVRRLLKGGVPPRKIWWFRLDHPLLMRYELGDLGRHAIHSSGATEDDPAYLFLDELTYSPGWDLWLKTFYDEAWSVRVAGSSSSTAALRTRKMESGVGRWEEQYLAPYLFDEYLALVDRPVKLPVGRTLDETIESCVQSRVDLKSLDAERRRFLLTGGFPELLLSQGREPEDEPSILLNSQRILRDDAVERAIYKDIPQAFRVDSPLQLERLLYTLAGQVAGIMSPRSICQEVGDLSQPTFDRYLSYLERAFLVFALPNYSENEATVQRRGRKLYFVDAAVRNAALQRGLGPLDDPGEMGLLTENMVAGHLKALGEVGQVRLYHWRDRNDEVDLIYDHPERPLAFEIGLSRRHHRRGLAALAERHPRFRGRGFLVSNQAEAILPRDARDGIGTLPIDLFLLAVGAQASRELRIAFGGP